MSLSEKQALRDQAVRIDAMARAAEREGLPASHDVARALRWGTASFLADIWEKKVAFEADLSEEAARAFYEANRQRYVSSGAVRYRRVMYPASQKAAASRVKAQLKKAPLSRLKNCVTEDWTEYGSISPSPVLSDALRTAPLGVVMGPLEIPGGFVLYEVLERHEEGPAPFEQCRVRVREDMVRAAVRERLEPLENSSENMP
jgi:hypothetical protein